MGKLRHVVLDGRKRDFGGGAFILLIRHLTSLTLLCGPQYDVPDVADPDGRKPGAKAIKVIRASPWRVLGTKFWRPRTDLKGFIDIWKSKERSFALRTEVQIIVDVDELWVRCFY